MDGQGVTSKPLFGFLGILTVIAVIAFVPLIFFLAMMLSPGDPSSSNGSGTGETPAEIGSEVQYAEAINAAVKKYPNVSPALVAAIIRAESGFNPNVTSSAGAQGMMQLMSSNSEGIDPFNPAQNIQRGTKLLSQHIKRYDGNIALVAAAYNAGPGAVQRYGGVPPYEETQEYVEKVTQYYQGYKKEVQNGKLEISGGQLADPAPQAEISSHFGPRNGENHHGQDFAAPIGTPILAADDGKVVKVKHLGDRSYGSYVVIEHKNRLQTLYAHMYKDQVQVREGQQVKRGQQIGAVGNNGRSSGPHLHFEVTQDGSKLNPQKLLR